MADEVVYRIIIEGGGDGGDGDTIKSPVSPSGNGSKDKDVGDFFAKYVGSKLKPVAAVTFAASTARTVGNIMINRVELQTGHSTFHQRAQYVHDKAWSLGMTAVGGAVAGAPFGPGGAAIGAVISVTTAGVNRLLEIGVAEQELRLKRQLEQVTLDLANIRAGTNGNRGR